MSNRDRHYRGECNAGEQCDAPPAPNGEYAEQLAVDASAYRRMAEQLRGALGQVECSSPMCDVEPGCLCNNCIIKSAALGGR